MPDPTPLPTNPNPEPEQYMVQQVQVLDVQPATLAGMSDVQFIVLALARKDGQEQVAISHEEAHGLVYKLLQAMERQGCNVAESILGFIEELSQDAGNEDEEDDDDDHDDGGPAMPGSLGADDTTDEDEGGTKQG